MTTETYVTQAHAARFLTEYFEKAGKPDPRDFGYLLNDQRCGKRPDAIPYEKIKGRILYRTSDLEEWAAEETKREKTRGSGIYEVEGSTGLERLVKLSVAVATKH